MPPVSTIHHASFTVSNMGRSIAFYRDVLGLKVLWDSAEAGVAFKGDRCDKITGCPGTEQRIVFLGIGGGVIELVEYTPMGRPLKDNKASDVGSSHVCFKTDDIHTLYDRLLANNVKVHCTPQEGNANLIMYFRDPDGIILEAIQGRTSV